MKGNVIVELLFSSAFLAAAVEGSAPTKHRVVIDVASIDPSQWEAVEIQAQSAVPQIKKLWPDAGTNGDLDHDH